MADDGNKKKFVTLEGLQYFLEKIKYEMAHNGPSNGLSETSSEISEEDVINEENKPKE